MLRVTTQHTGPAAGFTVWHFDGTLAAPAAAQDAADAAAAFWNTIRPLVTNDQTMTVLPEVAEVNVGTGQTEGVAATTTTPAIGTSTADQIPQAAHALVRWRTGLFFAGRELRGRTFIPGLGTASNGPSGEVILATRTSLNAAATTLLSDPDADFGVWSQKNAAFATASTGLTWTEWAVMRSRRE